MKDKILMLLFVLILGSILTTSLVVVNFYTTPLIEKNESLKLMSSVLMALGITYNDGSIEDTFAENVTEKETGDRKYYVAVAGELALPFEGSGLWGPITGILAMQPDLEEIKGVTIMRQEETPGLGSRIGEAPFLGQFVTKRFAPDLEMVQPGKGLGSSQIDSISGATLSSKAFVKILNDEYSSYGSLLGGGN